MGIIRHDNDNQKNNQLLPKSSIPKAPLFKNLNITHNIAENFSNSKSQNKYSGLINQGNTCYLNSLLQTLFMTPEFRLNILNWKYDESLHGKKEDCIPFQIKKLFSKLQLKKRYSEDTKCLTKSFQWENADSLYQHDIQELCRVLFEAIEMSLNSTDKNFINEIFEGITSSVVKCCECNYESTRTDKFLDISLPIRNDYDKIYNNSLEMALNNYIKVETLEKDNQYSCDQCKKKVDAKKFIKLEKLPNLLLFQLSRFEYNFQTDSRVKINDKVTFPLILDMNLFHNYENNLTPEYFDQKSEGKIDFNQESIKNEIQSCMKNGPDVYELSSIVIHSGTANGGHYYAYIKSFENDTWYDFNDSDVSEISEREIEKVFGAKSSLSSATGYVLLYRKILSEEKNKIKSIDNSIIEESILKEIEKDMEIIYQEERLWKEKFRNITLKIFYDNITKEIVFKKDENIKKMKEKIIKEFDLGKNISIESFKLRNYFINSDRYAEYIEDEDNVYKYFFKKNYRL